MTMLGKKHSNEAKEKMKLAKIGCTPWNKKPVLLKSCLYCGKEFKLFSGNGSYIKKFCSHNCYALSLKGHIPWNKGKNSYKNISDERRNLRHSEIYVSWRKQVFERDNYTCDICKVHSGNGKRVNLVAHHISRWSKYPELRYDVNNGITLCVNCHYKFPKYASSLNTANSVKPVTGNAVGNTEPSVVNNDGVCRDYVLCSKEMI